MTLLSTTPKLSPNLYLGHVTKTSPPVSVSPSVYVGFSEISALDYCGLVGTPVKETTVEFAPQEISTLVMTMTTIFYSDPFFVNGSISALVRPFIAYTIVGSTSLNYADLQQNCSTISGYSYIPGDPRSYGIFTNCKCPST